MEAATGASSEIDSEIDSSEAVVDAARGCAQAEAATVARATYWLVAPADDSEIYSEIDLGLWLLLMTRPSAVGLGRGLWLWEQGPVLACKFVRAATTEASPAAGRECMHARGHVCIPACNRALLLGCMGKAHTSAP